MLFSSLLFLYCFLPFVLLGNILIQQRYRNKFLLIASLVFYAWGGVTFTFIFMGSVLMNYYCGILISPGAVLNAWSARTASVLAISTFLPRPKRKRYMPLLNEAYENSRLFNCSAISLYRIIGPAISWGKNDIYKPKSANLRCAFVVPLYTSIIYDNSWKV